jgi:hypothetical protein
MPRSAPVARRSPEPSQGDLGAGARLPAAAAALADGRRTVCVDAGSTAPFPKRTQEEEEEEEEEETIGFTLIRPAMAYTPDADAASPAFLAPFSA